MTTQAEFRERRMAWVEALRSERYNQVFGWLHATEPDSGDQFYCCFGVACEVSNLADWQNATQMDENDDWERGDYYLGDDTELPNEVVEYYGLASNDGAFEWQSLPLKIKNGSTHGIPTMATVLRRPSDRSMIVATPSALSPPSLRLSRRACS